MIWGFLFYSVNWCNILVYLCHDTRWHVIRRIKNMVNLTQVYEPKDIRLMNYLNEDEAENIINNSMNLPTVHFYNGSAREVCTISEGFGERLDRLDICIQTIEVDGKFIYLQGTSEKLTHQNKVDYIGFLSGKVGYFQIRFFIRRTEYELHIINKPDGDDIGTVIYVHIFDMCYKPEYENMWPYGHVCYKYFSVHKEMGLRITGYELSIPYEIKGIYLYAVTIDENGPSMKRTMEIKLNDDNILVSSDTINAVIKCRHCHPIGRLVKLFKMRTSPIRIRIPCISEEEGDSDLVFDVPPVDYDLEKYVYDPFYVTLVPRDSDKFKHHYQRVKSIVSPIRIPFQMISTSVTK